jgi:orotidine-5'-phosphate decarboxylase
VSTPIVVALDVSDEASLDRLLKQLPPELCRVKIGKELFTNLGPKAIELCHNQGHEVFLDLKFHDIPNTCAMAVRSAARMGVWMVNVHASGGRAMMEASRDLLAGESHQPLLIGVTVLTSMTPNDLSEIGVPDDPVTQVLRLARLAKASGLDGVVCSAEEAPKLKAELGSEFTLVTPGIRPTWAAHDDQARIVTPASALANGSDYLVIGRPITRADSPADALQRIADELAHAS